MKLEIYTFVRSCTRGKMVSFNLVGYYERLGYPFRGRTMILLLVSTLLGRGHTGYQIWTVGPRHTDCKPLTAWLHVHFNALVAGRCCVITDYKATRTTNLTHVFPQCVDHPFKGILKVEYQIDFVEFFVEEFRGGSEKFLLLII